MLCNCESGTRVPVPVLFMCGFGQGKVDFTPFQRLMANNRRGFAILSTTLWKPEDESYLQIT
jgi:hypothetical protein